MYPSLLNVPLNLKIEALNNYKKGTYNRNMRVSTFVGIRNSSVTNGRQTDGQTGMKVEIVI